MYCFSLIHRVSSLQSTVSNGATASQKSLSGYGLCYGMRPKGTKTWSRETIIRVSLWMVSQISSYELPPASNKPRTSMRYNDFDLELMWCSVWLCWFSHYRALLSSAITKAGHAHLALQLREANCVGHGHSNEQVSTTVDVVSFWISILALTQMGRMSSNRRRPILARQRWGDIRCADESNGVFQTD